MATEVELQRRTSAGALIPWQVNNDGSEPTRDVDAIAKLEAVRLILDDNLSDIKRGLSDQEIRLDYGARTDGNPERVGKALNGTLVSSPTWVIQTFTYDASARLIRVTIITGPWA